MKKIGTAKILSLIAVVKQYFQLYNPKNNSIT